MKANEFRIGNWVEYFGNHFLVKGIRRENSQWYISAAENMKDLTLIYNVEDSFYPIHLTPEILEKCGFNKKTWGDIWEHPSLLIDLNEEKDYFVPYISEEQGFDIASVKFQHLHQLQNLYFALTGEELKVEL